LHKGQIKLLLSEIDFLTSFAEPGDTIVYAGAADGWHIPTLDAMFQPLRLRWRLFDPSQFRQEVYGWRKSSGGRVSVRRRIFTQEDAKYYGSNTVPRVLFISDIRTNEDNAIPDDVQVMQNQAMQMEWVQAMQPAACSLKFRGPFDYERTKERRHFKYLEGTMNVQVGTSLCAILHCFRVLVAYI